MTFVRLTDAWAYDGTAPVTLAALEDAGFHPALDCDPRGWMHFYGWPFGSPCPVTVWIPETEYQDAVEFLAAPCEPAQGESGVTDSFAGSIHTYRRWIYGVWLLGTIGPVGLLVGIIALASLSVRSRPAAGGNEW
jgi:hypothetical protein